MNINRALVVVVCILCLLVVVTIFNFKRTPGDKHHLGDFVCEETLMVNIQCMPEIVRSYEKVKDVYGRSNTLFFRYVNNSCNSCLNSQLNELLAFQEEIGKEYVWVFPAYPHDRNSRIQLSAELAKYNYRKISADSLIIPNYEGEQKSYFAWINGEGNIGMVFVPDRDNVYHTRKYFHEIEKMILML